MRATELMLGDWVFNTQNNKPEQVQEILTGNDIDYAVMLDYRDIYNEDDIEPIPLTAEILQKNGFKQTKTVYPYPTFEIDMNDCLIRVAFPRGSNVTKKTNPFVEIDSRNSYYNNECIFVHELQHALKICRINKTIEP